MADAIRGGIVINEIHPDPVISGVGGFDTDGNGTVSALDEFLEFYNSSDDPIDMGGIELWDPGSGHWFTFPPDSVIEPGGFALVVVGVQAGGSLPPVPPGSLAFDAGRGVAVLNNGGDVVFALDPDDETYISATYGGQPLIDPTDSSTWGGFSGSTGGLSNFPSGATQIGDGEDFGNFIAGQSIQRIPDGSDNFVNDGGATPGKGNVVICFVAGTLIDTPEGPRPVETFAPGDPVCAADGRILKLRQVHARKVSAAEQMAAPGLRPVRIRAGALGSGLPLRDLLVSRQHRMLVQSPVASRMFGQDKVLVAAVRLTSLPGVEIKAPSTPVTFVHLAFDRHEIIIAEGAPSESLYPGPEALRSLPEAAVNELMGLFPELAQGRKPQPACLIPPGRRQARLIKRLVRNRRFPIDGNLPSRIKWLDAS